MTLVADRFIRFDDGTVRDLATGDEVTLLEITLTGEAEQVARRDYCVARLDAEARGGGVEQPRGNAHAPPPEAFALVDFALVGESRWIEAYRPTTDAAAPREWNERRGWRDGVYDWMRNPMNAGNDWRGSMGTAPDASALASAPRDEAMRAGRVIAAIAATLDTASPRDESVIIGPVVDAIAAALDGLGPRDVRRLYVKAPEGARLDSFQAIVAREVRARGFIPLSASVVSTWPAIAPLLEARSVVLFGDARCVFSSVGSFSSFGGFGKSGSFGSFGSSGSGSSGSSGSFGSSGSLSSSSSSSSVSGVSGSIARALALVHRAACVVAAIVARVCDHVNVAALRLMPAASSSRPSFALRTAPLVGVMSEADSPPHLESAWPPQSVVQPAVAVSYDDPNLPSLFPRRDQIDQVAETAMLAPFAPFALDELDSEALVLSRVGWSSIITATSGDAVADTSTRDAASRYSANSAGANAEPDDAPPTGINGAEPDRATDSDPDCASLRRRSMDGGAPPTASSGSAWDSMTAPGSSTATDSKPPSDFAAPSDFGVASRYPPLRLVERRIESEPAERLAVAIPVVTTMVSGYGEAVDALVGRGRWAAASRALRVELAAHERRTHRHDAARASIALGRLHLAMGDVSPAARCFDRAGELASASGGGSGAESESESGGPGDSNARLIGEALRWSGMAALDDANLEGSERLLRSALAAIGPEADPHQQLAIDLALARCLFWQGRAREIVLPSLDALSPVISEAASGDTGAADSSPRDTLAAVILRVERWRRAARLAIADGDLSSAGDAIARACRIARGDDEEDLRSAGCRIEEAAGSRARTRKERSSSLRAASVVRPRAQGRTRAHATSERCGRARIDAVTTAARAGYGARVGPSNDTANEARIREALRAACHLDAARLQFAIGDTGSGDAHLRESLKLSRAPARTVRVQLLQLARFRAASTSEGRRRFERLSAALRQPRMSKLVRIQARYLIDPRSRRTQELAAFLDRHGDTALASYGHAHRRGGSPMLEAFQDVLRICHETPDDLAALARVSAYLRDQLRALSVAIYGASPNLNPNPNPDPDQNQNQNDERVSPGPERGASVVRYAVAGSTRVLSPGLATRAIESGLLIPPTYRADALDAAVSVRYGGAPIGAIVVRWSIDAALDHTTASALISAAAAAISPHLRAALDRERLDGGDAAASSHSPARTLGLLGISSAIDTLRHTITRVASAPFHVLIEGESGSGKELVARALHQHGPRRHRRFCAVNCAAFTDELLEAELFGHTRGAFTGALTERAGLFEEADGGTLFLDEIGELSPRGQAKLLRVIQDGETRRIGENLPRRVDTRIVAATNRSLRDEADAGQFRADLLYRLDVIRITVPPLRARPEDVPVLARAFWDEAIARLGSRATLDPATLTALARYHWPGNVRELHNAIMALAVHAPPRGRVTPSLLPAPIATCSTGAPGAANDDETERANHDANDRGHDEATDGASSDARHAAEDGRAGREPLPFEGPLEDAKRAFESRYIRAALARAGGSPSRAAHSLGLTRQGLAKLMARLGLDDEAACRASRRRTTIRKERSPP